MKILVAVHDAGGAEILSSLRKKYSHKFIWEVLAAGPAKKSFCGKKIPFVELKAWDLEEAERQIKKIKPALLLVGTGWGTDLERNFTEAARKQKVQSAAYLDGWFNFCERFGSAKDWKKNLPTYVLVGDEDAYRLALSNGFPKQKLVCTENPFWELEELQKPEPSVANGTSHLLYVMQPGQKTYQKWMKRLQKRKNNIFLYPNLFFKSLGENKNKVTVRLRPHPSEVTDKVAHYLKTLRKEGYQVEQSQRGATIFEDLRWADGVVGLESMALIMGLAMKKKAISYLPEKKLRCRLPQKGVKKIRNAKMLQREILSPKPRKEESVFLENQKKFNRRFSFLKTVKELIHE